MKSRYARLPASVARVLLAALVLLMGYGLALDVEFVGADDGGIEARDEHDSDLALYRAIIARMQAGEGYYSATGAEQHTRNYPTKPFLTWRLPTTAWVLSGLGEGAAAVVLKTLTVVTVLTWAWVLIRLGLRRRGVVAGALLLGTGVAATLPPESPFLYVHEAWAAVLIALSLAVRQLWWPLAVMLGLAALAFRELALPYVCVMAACALWEGRRREAIGWSGAILAFFLFLGLHAWMVSGQVGPDAREGGGWLAAGCWRFVLETGQWNIAALLTGPWLVALAAPLALLGAASWQHPMGNRLALIVGGYTVAFLFAGRPNNDYWGITIAPLVALALVFVPSALYGLWRAAFPTQTRAARADSSTG